MHMLPNDGHAVNRRARRRRNVSSRPPEHESQFPLPLTTDLPVDIVLERLRVLRRRITGNGPWMASCPAHHDSTPSLSIKETEDKSLLVHCHAGCDTGTVLARLGLDFRHLYPSLYALQFGTRPRKAHHH